MVFLFAKENESCATFQAKGQHKIWLMKTTTYLFTSSKVCKFQLSHH